MKHPTNQPIDQAIEHTIGFYGTCHLAAATSNAEPSLSALRIADWNFYPKNPDNLNPSADGRSELLEFDQPGHVHVADLMTARPCIVNYPGWNLGTD